VTTIDEGLIKRAQSGDAKATDILLTKLRPRVLQHLTKYFKGDDTIAQDVTQETLYQVWQKFGDFKGEDGAALVGWALTIATNLANKVYKEWSAGMSPDINEGLEPDTDVVEAGTYPSPEEILIGEETADAALTALNSLPDRIREVAELIVIDELSYEEVAEELMVPVGTIRSRWSRARELLKGAVPEAPLP
jgi:RNA polymerase sigma-70 factor (ECF subfamily)